MNLLYVEAYEGHWRERLDENIYRINIEKEATVELVQKTWVGYSNHSRVLIKGREQDKPTAFLYWGTLLEIEAQEKHKMILFQLLEIMILISAIKNRGRPKSKISPI